MFNPPHRFSSFLVRTRFRSSPVQVPGTCSARLMAALARGPTIAAAASSSAARAVLASPPSSSTYSAPPRRSPPHAGGESSRRSWHRSDGRLTFVFTVPVLGPPPSSASSLDAGLVRRTLGRQPPPASPVSSVGPRQDSPRTPHLPAAAHSPQQRGWFSPRRGRVGAITVLHGSRQGPCDNRV